MIIKNSNIRRIIFENRYVIFIIIFGIILVLSLINTLNENVKKESKSKLNQIQNTTSIQKNESSTQTAIPEQNISSNTNIQEDNTKIIEDFISYCNNKDIEKAYSLLTQECKEEVFFSDIQYFEKNYVNKIFTSKKMYSIQIWNDSYIDTYRIKIYDDALATGQASSLENAIEDYYTVINNNEQYKLNIDGYIGRRQIGKEKEENSIKITVISKDIFKDYEIYNFNCENMTSNTILLDSKETVNSVYLVGSNDNNYGAYTYEIETTMLMIPARVSKNVSIRFNKIYSNQVPMRKIVFQDIITNYDVYSTMENKKAYTNRFKMQIEI